MSRLFYHVMQDNAGNLLFDVSGTMRLAGTGTAATIYGDEALTVILPNPMTNHPSFGSFKCFLGSGDYDFYMAKSGYSFETLTGVQGHGTMAQQDAANVAITGGSATLTQGLVLPDRLGDNIRGIYTSINALPGTNRLFIDQVGDAPSVLRGNVQVGSGPAVSTDTVNNRVGIGPGVFAPTTTLDVNGGVRLRQTLGIGTFPSPGTNTVSLLYDRAAGSGLVIQPTVDTGGQALYFLNAAAAPVGSINTTDSATSFNTSSDVRLKEGIETLAGALDVVRALRPVSFRWQADGSPGRGFLAHELQQVVPDAVTGEPDEVNPDGSIKPQQVDHSRLVPWLTAALQEAMAQIQGLTARVASLEQQLGV